MPVTDLRPFLHAPLHLAVVKDDPSQFLHEHGQASEHPTGIQSQPSTANDAPEPFFLKTPDLSHEC
jgi:hypothetical protein